MKISNPFLSVQASALGGELTSIQLFNQELLYQKDGSWPFQDHVVFPIIGRGDRYSCHGVPMKMDVHGFPRTTDMKEEQINETCMRFSMESTPDMLRNYPYPFRLSETFILDDDVLVRRHEVTNLGQEVMPFGIGDHAAYRVKFGEAKLFLSQNQFVPSSKDGVTHAEVKDLPVQGEILLDEAKKFLLDQGTLILVHNRDTIVLQTGLGVTIELQYPTPYVAIWTPEDKSPFLCIEPWWGLPTLDFDPDELMERNSLNHLDPGCSKTFTTRVRFRMD